MLLTTLESKYPNLVYLFELLLGFPVSNAKIECAFSTMRRIKRDWHNRLNENTFDHLMQMWPCTRKSGICNKNVLRDTGAYSP